MDEPGPSGVSEHDSLPADHAAGPRPPLPPKARSRSASLRSRVSVALRRPSLPNLEQPRAGIELELKARLLSPIAGSRRWGWVATIAVTIIAGVLRLVDLGRPHRLVFDETYYVKDAYSLLTLGYPGQWADDWDENFAAGDFSGLSPEAEYVVHPSVGKWMIAIGMRILGPDSSAGWRISAAVIGTLSVLLLVRIARRLFSSNLLGATAGLLLAIDGTHIALSRISILDIFLQFWVLAGFAALLLDREHYRRRLASRAARVLADHGRYLRSGGPRVGVRWWLLVASVCFGLACGVKWSGAYAVAVFGVVAVFWSMTARRSVGIPRWLSSSVLAGGARDFFTFVPTAAAVYVATWLPWFLQANTYHRQWAANVNAKAADPVRTWMPDWLNSWWDYHLQMWQFHTSLSTPHDYMSNPLTWLIQWRPTSFAWREIDDASAPSLCGSTDCVAAVTSLGNPVVWWLGAVALLVVLWHALRRRDWRAWAILAAYAAMYLPWLAYMQRTIFTFYTVAFAPFVALALTFMIGQLLGKRQWPLRERLPGIWIAGAIVVLAVAACGFFWPIWSAQWVPRSFWYMHMWLPSWI